MRTIKRTVPDLPNVTNDYSKYLNLLEWKGIIEGKNIFDVDQSSLADAKNIYVNEKNRLVSRDPLQEDKSLPENAVPDNYKLFEIYNVGNKALYVSKNDENKFAIKIDNSELLDLETYHISIIEHYVICFNEQNARVYDTNNIIKGWQKLTDLAEIPITLSVVGATETTYEANEFTQAYKESYVWSVDSQPNLPGGNAEVVLLTSSNKYIWTIPDTNKFTDYRILRPLNIKVDKLDLITIKNNIICVARPDYVMVSYDEGLNFDKIWYPTHGKFLNVASVSENGDFFFFVAEEAVYRYNLGEKSWEGGIFYFHSNDSAEYGSLLDATNYNALGYNNICHFLASDTFTFILRNVNDIWIFYKGPELSEESTTNFKNSLNTIKIENVHIGPLELDNIDLIQKDTQKLQLKISIDSESKSGIVFGIFKISSFNFITFSIFSDTNTIFYSYKGSLDFQYPVIDSIKLKLQEDNLMVKSELIAYNPDTPVNIEGFNYISNSLNNIISIKGYLGYLFIRYGANRLARYNTYDNIFDKDVLFTSVSNNNWTPISSSLIWVNNAIYNIDTQTLGISIPLEDTNFKTDYYNTEPIVKMVSGKYRIYRGGYFSELIWENEIGKEYFYPKLSVYEEDDTYIRIIDYPYEKFGGLSIITSDDNSIYCSTSKLGSEENSNTQISKFNILNNSFTKNYNTLFQEVVKCDFLNNKLYFLTAKSRTPIELYILNLTSEEFSYSITNTKETSVIPQMKIFKNKLYLSSSFAESPIGTYRERIIYYDIITGQFSDYIDKYDSIFTGLNSLLNVNQSLYFGASGSNYNLGVIENKEINVGAFSNVTLRWEQGQEPSIIINDIYYYDQNDRSYFPDSFPFRLGGAFIDNLKLTSLDFISTTNLPVEIKNRDNTWISGDYFYMKVGNTIYTNNLTSKDIATLTYTYNPPDNKYIKVPKVSYSDTELYLGLDNILQITHNSKDGTNLKFNLPKRNNQSFISNITSMLNISTTEVAIFFNDDIKICSKVEDEVFGFRYDYYNTKLSTGVRLGDSTINTLEGAYSIFPTRRGLAAMNYQAFMSTSDQVINYITNSIETYWTKFYDNSSIIKIIQWRDWLVITNLTKSILLFDLNRQTWWKWEVPLKVNQLLTNQVELKLISDNLYVFKPHSIYKDFPAKKTQRNIDWYIHSQLLHFNRPTYFKNIRQLIFQIVDDVNNKNFENNGEETNNSIIAQMVLYRKRITNREPEVIGFKIDKIRTFVKRFNYWKINEVQWKLANDIETASPVKLQLDGVMIKYEIGEEVR